MGSVSNTAKTAGDLQPMSRGKGLVGGKSLTGDIKGGGILANPSYSRVGRFSMN